MAIYRKCAIRTQVGWDSMTTLEQAVYDAHYTDLDLWSAGEGTPGNYTKNSEQIIATNYKVVLPGCKKYFFAVKAFNECGNSSDFSDEISNEIPSDKPGVVTNCVINSVSM